MEEMDVGPKGARTEGTPARSVGTDKSEKLDQSANWVSAQEPAAKATRLHASAGMIWHTTTSPRLLAHFWAQARTEIPMLPPQLPEAWSFGGTADVADELLELVLRRIKTATASSLWDYEAEGEPLPEVGDFSIVLDGRGVPRAVIQTTEVRVVPFGDVDEAHAYAEGEGDRSLKYWREVHEECWRNYSSSPRGFEPEMPAVCERFRLVYPALG